MKKILVYVALLTCALMLSACKDTSEKTTEDYTDVELSNDKNAFFEKAEEIKEYSESHLKTAVTQSDMNIESGIVLEKWEALLTEVYECLEKTLPKSEYKALQENESEWLLEKEKAINEASEKWQNGSGEPMARNMAEIQLLEERFSYLVSFLK